MKLRLFVTVILATLLQINVVASKCYKGKSSEKRTFQHRGVRCYLCPPGTYMVKPCTQSSSTRCSTCGNNTYIDRFNYCTQCWGCTQLCNYRDQYVKLECSPTQKRVCACVPGKRMFGDMCQDITECEPGYYMKRENNHKCAPCPRGTYSNTHNVNENCTPHTNCTMFGLKYKRKGNRTSDVSCYDDIDVTSTPPVATTGVTSDDTNKGFSTSTDEESTTKVEELHITADGTHTQLKESSHISTVEIIPHDVAVVVGNPVVLRCIASGYPQPTITWSRHAGELDSNHQIHHNVLMIIRARSEDKDVYVCEAENIAGTMIAFAQVDIHMNDVKNGTNKIYDSGNYGQELSAIGLASTCILFVILVVVIIVVVYRKYFNRKKKQSLQASGNTHGTGSRTGIITENPLFQCQSVTLMEFHQHETVNKYNIKGKNIQHGNGTNTIHEHHQVDRDDSSSLENQGSKL